MQFVIPRIVLVVLAMAVALFCYFESLYYYHHAISGAEASTIKMWMWVFRMISITSFLFAAFVTFNLIHKPIP